MNNRLFVITRVLSGAEDDLQVPISVSTQVLDYDLRDHAEAALAKLEDDRKWPYNIAIEVIRLY